MKRGQGNVIGVVLLILIVIAAIVIITSVIIPLVKESGSETETGVGSISTDLEIKNVEIFLNGDVDITVHRGSDKNEITELKFVFYEEGGESKVVEVKGEGILDTTTSKVFSFNHDDIENENKIEKVSVVPVVDGKLGIEIQESESSILTNRDGKRIYKNPDGLVSWWKFDGNARDSVSSNHGEFVGGTLITSDTERGEVASFDGTDDYASFPDSDDLEFGNSGSVLAWFKLKAWAHEKIITKDVEGGDGCVDYNFNLHVHISSKKIGVNICEDFSDNVIQDENGEDFGLDNWYHVAVITNNGNLEVFINGVSVFTDDSGLYILADNSQDWFIGKGHNYYLNGYVDDAMIFNRALVESEVKGLYVSQKR